jgi:hypothetical protein
MIHFDAPPEPPTFRTQAREPGLAWLRAHQDAERPKDFWSPFKPALADGFHQLCGYSAMYEPVGTVDHYRSCKDCRDSNAGLAYSWKNYRFSAQWINSSKRTADSAVLDPFKVQDGWFEILLPSLQLEVSSQIPARQRAKAEHTLDRLHLRHDERVIRQRREWYRMHKDGELPSLDGLRKKAPLIAQAVEKWYRDNPGTPLP